MKNKTVATDSFQLIEMSTIGENNITAPFIVDAKALQNIKGDVTAETLATLPLIDETFPEYEQIIPKEKDERFQDSYNVDYLIEGLTVLKKMKNKWGRCTIHFYGEGKPLVITAKNKETEQEAKYLIMPLSK